MASHGVALVTGGGGGIGRAEALELARRNVDIAIVYRSNLQEAETTAAACREIGVRAGTFHANLTDSDAVQRMVDQVIRSLGKIGILVNNAGAMGSGFNSTLVDMEPAIWREMIDAHLTSTYLCIKHCSRDMMAVGWGRVINTSSIHGRVGGRSTLGAYGAAKAAIEALTKTAARELGPHGITCNCVAPGFVGTDRLMSYMAEERIRQLSEQVPVGRIARPEEIASVVAFLASREASYVNGAIVDINGWRTEYL
ncbi:MAG: SDR family NAD(P)-dependent oxidoreductase [Hyphomicrobiaceae bacterium]